MAKIKICGLRRVEDIAYVNQCKPDYIGFVFAGSRRRVTKEQAKELRVLLNPDIMAVGVFVNEAPRIIAELVQEGIIDMVQLHGEEDEEYIKQLKSLIKDAVIIKAVRVAGEEDILRAQELSADYLLFDTFSQTGYGGTGECFDWKLLQNVEKKITKPFFLAGGINCENVEKALAMCSPFGVDVSSAVETNGYKDSEKILAMVNKVRKIK